ncbi:MAG: EVE domain-containing protein [Candidatus Rokubacteria bacterium]|nr:EVE domain-containing protein [Candidatus Rokubacteria bacterium]
MPDGGLNLTDALAKFDRQAAAEWLREAETERQELLKRFALDDWPRMPLEQFALGQVDSEDTFCRWLEFRSRKLGSMRGGSSRKLIIYKHRDRPGWFFPRTYADEREAWAAVRDGFVQAFAHAREGRWEAIDAISALQAGPALKLKALHVYFPNDIISVYSKAHIQHFLSLLNRPEGEERTDDVVRLNRALLAALRSDGRLRDWPSLELMLLLYAARDPRESRRIVKIAPGENARYWDDCLREGYICVGWDDVGNLEDFESKEQFYARFAECYTTSYKGHRPTLRKKADEIWTLMELEPGDLVIANQGISKILAIGEVVEPGYEWRPDRPEYRNTVRVRWDTGYAKEIEPQKRWALVTVAPVPATLYRRIIERDGEPSTPPAPLPVDPILKEIAQALGRKGQVILYGPPGTGKTYTARRFAVWWLLRDGRPADAAKALADPDELRRLELELSTQRAARHVWWAVANPREWAWDRLFSEGRVSYRHGRIQRNYPLVQPDDLVIGYQASPDKRIVALARVTKGLTTVAGEPRIELAPLQKLRNGLTFDELAADPVLRVSEPMRFRNQGTLFRLTQGEADHALALLAEREPAVEGILQSGPDAPGAVGQLTLLTFHPSYSYEDFIEGFRPSEAATDTLVLHLEDGIFKRVCQEAQAHPDRKYLLLIDEINRANLPKVFGELLTLLEADKRGVRVTLPQSKQPLAIPRNVYLLGTMNTADRSIRLLDSALRRRFAFVELMPDLTALRGGKIRGLDLDDFLEELNRRIIRLQGREKQIGQAFLLDGDQPLTDPDEFGRRFRQEILPLLQEYCYDNYATLATYLGETLVDRDAQTVNEPILADPERLLAALEDEFTRQPSPEA